MTKASGRTTPGGVGGWFGKVGDNVGVGVAKSSSAGGGRLYDTSTLTGSAAVKIKETIQVTTNKIRLVMKDVVAMVVVGDVVSEG